MFELRTKRAGIRSIWALALALVLALRLVTPAGFMPAVEHGRLTIVICDDGGGPAPVHHHHGKTARHHEPCPYTSLSAFGAADAEFTPVLASPPAIASLPQWAARASFFGRRSHERPPLRGPPLPA